MWKIKIIDELFPGFIYFPWFAGRALRVWNPSFHNSLYHQSFPLPCHPPKMLNLNLKHILTLQTLQTRSRKKKHVYNIYNHVYNIHNHVYNIHVSHLPCCRADKSAEWIVNFLFHFELAPVQKAAGKFSSANILKIDFFGEFQQLKNSFCSLKEKYVHQKMESQLWDALRFWCLHTSTLL